MQELRDAGYLPAAVRNYLALLGWGTQDDTTILSTEELIERFDLSGVGRSSAIFDEQKLRWLNGRYMREMDLDEYTERGRAPPGPGARRAPAGAACAIAQEKAQTLAEVWPLIGFLFDEPETDEKAWRKVMKDGALPLLTEALEALRGAELIRAGGARNRPRADPRRARREAGKALSADPGRDHGDVGLPGDLRIACGIRARSAHLSGLSGPSSGFLRRSPTETVRNQHMG